MDPRHPEQAKTQIEDLVKQYDKAIKEIEKATTIHQINEIEQKTVFLIQNIGLTAGFLRQDLINRGREARLKLEKAHAQPTPKAGPIKVQSNTEPTPKAKKGKK